MLRFSASILPPVVKNLLIINGLMYFATLVLQDALGINIVQLLGLSYIFSDNFRPWQILTHIFMHGTFMHLFSNMFALWMFGTAIENYLGSKRFLKYYLLTGIGAAVIHMMALHYEIQSDAQAFKQFNAEPTPIHLEQIFNKYTKNNTPQQYQEILYAFKQNPRDIEWIESAKKIVEHYKREFLNTNVVSLGASGAVFGVLLAFGMLFPNSLILIWLVFPMKAKYLVILYGLFELFSGVANRPGDNIAHFAHLGGMVIGFILFKLWNIKRPFDFRI